MGKKLIRYITNFVIVALVLFCIYALVMTTIFKKKYVNVFGYTFYVVASGSMTGTIDVNDMVIVKITNDFNVNDIITYYKDGYFITHRVISEKDNQIITKGDVNNSEDSPITKKDIIGKVVLIFPFAAIFETLGAVILIVLIVIMFNFDKIFSKFIIKKHNDEKENRIEIVQDNSNLTLLEGFIGAIRLRNNNTVCKNLDEYWIIKLRYIFKITELIKLKRYDLLKILMDSFRFDEESTKVFSSLVLNELDKENYTVHITLLMNAILYKDELAYQAIFRSLKNNIYENYLNKIN